MRRIRIAAAVLALVVSGPAYAETFNVFISNKLGETIRIFVDGQYACEMAPQGSCMAPVPDGAHTFRAERSDGSYVEAPVNNPGSSLHWSVGGSGFVEFGG